MTQIAPPAHDESPAELHFRGFRINPMTGAGVVQAVASAVRGKRRLIMANINLHGMALAYTSAGMRQVLQAPQSLVMIDSMPLLFALRLMGHKLGRRHRTTSLEFYDAMFALGQAEGWRFGFVGGTQDVMINGLAALRARFPALQIEGRQGYFNMSDWSQGSAQAELVAWMNAGQHDVMIVGMGMPRQEEWICQVMDKVGVPVFLPAGGYLDYQVGAQVKAPRWLGQIGLEWCFRLLTAPRRMSYRYLVEPVVLLWHMRRGSPFVD